MPHVQSTAGRKRRRKRARERGYVRDRPHEHPRGRARSRDDGSRSSSDPRCPRPVPCPPLQPPPPYLVREWDKERSPSRDTGGSLSPSPDTGSPIPAPHQLSRPVHPLQKGWQSVPDGPCQSPPPLQRNRSTFGRLGNTDGSWSLSSAPHPPSQPPPAEAFMPVPAGSSGSASPAQYLRIGCKRSEYAGASIARRRGAASTAAAEKQTAMETPESKMEAAIAQLRAAKRIRMEEIVRRDMRESVRLKAIAEVSEGVCREPYFEPSDWHSRYQPALGHYKEFLLREVDHFDVVDETEGVFSVNIK